MKILFILLFLVSCGKTYHHTKRLPEVGVPSPDGVVVMARASMHVTVGSSSLAKLSNFVLANAYANTQPVTVVLAGSTIMQMSNVGFSVPAISNELLDFGNLAITEMRSNDLRKCGVNGNQKCSKALFRVYTTAAGEGFWNTADAYGVPLLVNDLTVGLNTTGAVVTHMIELGNKNVSRLSDFDEVSFNIDGDFYNAGAGTYGTTIHVEFGLAP